MDFRVEITPAALADLNEAFRYIAADSPERANAWYDRLHLAIESLGRFPERCGIAPEHYAVDFEIRQKLFGKYRILFAIERDTVQVLRVQHGARPFLSPEEFERG